MKITKYYEGLERIENGDYVLKGDLISNDTIEIELDDRLVCKGSIISYESIRAGHSINAAQSIVAGWGIEAGWSIKACQNIKAGWGIKAGGSIEAGENIKAGLRIFAGVNTYQTSDECDKKIVCKKLVSGEIAYGELIERRD